MKELVLAAYILAGGAFIAMSVPLIQRRVKPNRWYGFRTPRTLKDPNVWYPANEFGARRMLWVGVAWIAAAIILYFPTELSFVAYVSAVGAVATVGTIIMVIQSFAFIRRLPEKRSGDDPEV